MFHCYNNSLGNIKINILIFNNMLYFSKLTIIINNLYYKLGFTSFFYFLFNPQLKKLPLKTKKKIDFIKKFKIRYQPIVLPKNIIIPKNCSTTILDSRIKLKNLKLPKKLNGKTFLDIGCAEGFFCIEAARRGAKKVLGIESDRSRIKIAKKVNKIWQFNKTVEFKNLKLENLRANKKFDIVLCLAVTHHYHGRLKGKKMLDTWAILTNKKYLNFYKNMIKIVKKVALHTKEITYWEYPFTYVGYKTKPKDVDFQVLAKKWEEEKIYRRVDFIGFSSRSLVKDRPLYRAYK